MFEKVKTHFGIDYNNPSTELWNLDNREVFVKISLVPSNKGQNQIDFTLTEKP